MISIPKIRYFLRTQGAQDARTALTFLIGVAIVVYAIVWFLQSIHGLGYERAKTGLYIWSSLDCVQVFEDYGNETQNDNRFELCKQLQKSLDKRLEK